MTAEKLALWAPFDPTLWSPEEGLPRLIHLPTGHAYTMLGVVVREKDTVPCAVYQRIVSAPVPVWCRPLVEVLEGTKWEWDERENETMSKLAQTLAQYEEGGRR
jgi:hypothetical protein